MASGPQQQQQQLCCSRPRCWSCMTPLPHYSHPTGWEIHCPTCAKVNTCPVAPQHPWSFQAPQTSHWVQPQDYWVQQDYSQGISAAAPLHHGSATTSNETVPPSLPGTSVSPVSPAEHKSQEENISPLDTPASARTAAPETPEAGCSTSSAPVPAPGSLTPRKRQFVQRKLFWTGDVDDDDDDDEGSSFSDIMKKIVDDGMKVTSILDTCVWVKVLSGAPAPGLLQSLEVLSSDERWLLIIPAVVQEVKGKKFKAIHEEFARVYNCALSEAEYAAYLLSGRTTPGRGTFEVLGSKLRVRKLLLTDAEELAERPAAPLLKHCRLGSLFKDLDKDVHLVSQAAVLSARAEFQQGTSLLLLLTSDQRCVNICTFALPGLEEAFSASREMKFFGILSCLQIGIGFELGADRSSSVALEAGSSDQMADQNQQASEQASPRQDVSSSKTLTSYTASTSEKIASSSGKVESGLQSAIAETAKTSRKPAGKASMGRAGTKENGSSRKMISLSATKAPRIALKVVNGNSIQPWRP